MFRIGSGVDIHKLEENKPLIIGGVKIPYEKGFLAHSDGDILIHALCDALLGAAGLKDIGSYFPDNDPGLKNSDSLNHILPAVIKMVYELSWNINNIDITIIIEKPKMAPYIDEMKNHLAKIMNIAPSLIAIKAKRTENCILNQPYEAAMTFVTVLLIKG